MVFDTIIDISLKILQGIIGILLIFIIPGVILDRYFIKSHTLLEKIIISITLSITTAIIIGLILGILGIFNYWNSLIGFIVVILLLLIIVYFRKTRF